MKMEQRTLEDIQRTQREDNKSTGSFSAKKREKIQSGNRCFRTRYRGSTIPRTKWEVETDSVSIEDNATCRKKLQNLRQRVIGNSGSSDQVETIFVGCIGNIQNQDRP